MASGGDARERLKNIWSAWELVPSETLGDAQLRALDAAESWLKQGADDAATVIRAAQILASDPERPGSMHRPCWMALRRALTDVWSNVGNGKDHMIYGQALLLAAWPINVPNGWHIILPPLLDSTWTATLGRSRQRAEVELWRTKSLAALAAPRANDPTTSPPTMAEIADYGGVDLSQSSQALQHVTQHQGHAQFNTVGIQLVQLLNDERKELQNLGNAVSEMSRHLNEYASATKAYHDQHVRAGAPNRTEMRDSELSLLWWGQSRYSRTLRMPYRRIFDQDEVLWWASSEAARLSLSLDVEAAAAYLVETLHALGQNILEKKPLRKWMGLLHAILVRAGVQAPVVSEHLDRIASEDALGLPITWVRLRAARNEPLSGADDAVALNLDTEIDRGEWASWIFRESILDLRLGQSA